MTITRTFLAAAFFSSISLHASDYHDYRESWAVSEPGTIQVGGIYKENIGILLVKIKNLDGDLTLFLRHHFAPEAEINCDVYHYGNDESKETTVKINGASFSASTVCGEQEGNKVGSYLYISSLDDLPKSAINHLVSQKEVRIETMTGQTDVPTKGFVDAFEDEFTGIYTLPEKAKLITSDGKLVTTTQGDIYASKSLWLFADRTLYGYGYLEENYKKEQTLFDGMKMDASIAIEEDVITFAFREPLGDISCDKIKSMQKSIKMNGVTIYPATYCNDESQRIDYVISTSNEGHSVVKEFKLNREVTLTTPFNEFYFDTTVFRDRYSKIEQYKVNPYSPVFLACELMIGEPTLMNLEMDLKGKRVNERPAAVEEDEVLWMLGDGINALSRFTGKITYTHGDNTYSGKCEKQLKRLF